MEMSFDLNENEELYVTGEVLAIYFSNPSNFYKVILVEVDETNSDYVENNNCSNITLEVRKSNIIAINIYKKFKFKVIAERKNYYGNEDAIMMLREV